jgi:hypothetical protein
MSNGAFESIARALRGRRHLAVAAVAIGLAVVDAALGGILAAPHVSAVHDVGTPSERLVLAGGLGVAFSVLAVGAVAMWRDVGRRFGRS